MSTCSILVPRRYSLIQFEFDENNNLGECIRERNHFGPHAFVDADGQMVAWEDDYTCDCCTPEEDERCYTCWKIDSLSELTPTKEK